MCWFYNLSGEVRLVGRMCFGLTVKWHTVISELQPSVFLSSLLCKPRCSKRKKTESDLHLLYFDFFFHPMIYVMTGNRTYFKFHYFEFGQLIWSVTLVILAISIVIKIIPLTPFSVNMVLLLFSLREHFCTNDKWYMYNIYVDNYVKMSFLYLFIYIFTFLYFYIFCYKQL